MKRFLNNILTVSAFMAVAVAISQNRVQENNDPALKSKVEGWMQNTRGLNLLENKGQMGDLQGRPDNDLLFKVTGKGVDIYVTTWGLSYVFTTMERVAVPQLGNTNQLLRSVKGETETTTVHYCRADMDLVGAVIKKENVIKEGESLDRKDYYLPQCPDGLTNVHSYQKITVKDIYPGIDWIIYTINSNQGIKYDFVVHPGADPSLIRLKYKWTDKPSLQKNGSLKISTPMGNIEEGMPVSFGSDKTRKIKTDYLPHNDEITFKIDKYDSRDTLLIDPMLIWATYSGGAGEEVTSISTDGTYLWLTETTALPGFPRVDPNPGLSYFQGVAGGTNGSFVIIQFTTCGQLLWCTYYGGSGDDASTSINSDGTNVWLTGFTNSTDFPTSFPLGSYQQAALGGVGATNAFIIKFSCASCARVWASYYGGSTADKGESISSDGANVWVTGSATSTDFPNKFLLGAYNQPVLRSGRGNAFVLQFSCATSSRTWASYYGGDGEDQGNAVSSDGTNVWVTGYTKSTNFPTNFPGGSYRQSALGGVGAENAFLLKFKCNTSASVWATYYGGSSLDGGASISSDGSSVWVTGGVTSTDFSTKSAPGAYNQPSMAGYGNAYILQFDCVNAGLTWGTYYGGSGIGGDQGYSIQSDGTNVWITGYTRSKDFPLKAPACGFPLQPFGKGSNIIDAFILQFSTSGALAWSTFYGTDTENEGSAPG